MVPRFFDGAGGRTRTGDLLITNQLLYQLSYTSEYEGAAFLPKPVCLGYAKPCSSAARHSLAHFSCIVNIFFSFLELYRLYSRRHSCIFASLPSFWAHRRGECFSVSLPRAYDIPRRLCSTASLHKFFDNIILQTVIHNFHILFHSRFQGLCCVLSGN